MKNKTDIRIVAKNIRKNLATEDLSLTLCKNLKTSAIYAKAKHIMLFYPLKDEINTLSLLKDSDKHFYLPQINGKDMEVCPYKRGDELKLSTFKTQEPISQAVNPQILDLIIVPALMADKHNYRLGYGKGYYDRFLTKTEAKSVVLIPKELIVENLPTESHDKIVDFIITN